MPDRRHVWFAHWGVPVEDSGSQRTYHLLRHIGAEHRVTFVDLGDQPVASYSSLPDAVDAYCFFGEPIHMSNSWRRTFPDRWVARHHDVGQRLLDAARSDGADLLYLCAWSIAPHALAGSAPDRPWVVWDADAPSVYHQTRSAANSVAPISRAHSAWLASRYRRFERSLVRRVDRIAVPGQLDVDAFERAGAHAVRIPNEIVPVGRTEASRRFSFGFLGSKWAPNADGLAWFLRRVWPKLLETHPDATLAVAGTVPVPRTPGVTSLGRVDDKDAFYSEVSGVVVPVDYGSGTQQKLLETAALGIPVYTTPFGVASTGLPHLISLHSIREWHAALRDHLDGRIPPVAPTTAASAADTLGRLLEEIP